MQLSFFLVAALALSAAHLLRLPNRGKVWVAFVAFLAGLLVTSGLIRGLADLNNLGRSTAFDRIVNAAIAEANQDQAPLIVFTGASYSRNAIDPERLTLALREAGYPHRVINLSIEAASVLERHQHLEQFMRLSGRVPDVVFIETSQAFDTRVAFMFGNAKFTARAIEQYDLRTSLHTLSGLSEGACQGVTGCAKDLVFLGLHTGLNLFNVGRIGRGEAAEEAGLETAWDPQYVPRAEVDPAEIERLSVAIVPIPNWIQSYRQNLHRALEAKGVREVAYYQPPILSAEMRAYATQVCATELAEHVCFAPTDPGLLAQLNGPVWFDADHLLDAGAAIYSRWLIMRLLESDVLAAAT